MFYLWKDKRSTPERMLVYLTDYKEKNEQGQVKVDGFGFVDAELIFEDEDKGKVIAFAQDEKKLFEGKKD